MKFILIIFIFAFANCFALQMSDYVPNFLLPSDGTTESVQIPVRALVDTKRNSSSSKSWYCVRNQDNVGNVFCNKTNTSDVVKSLTYESSTVGDKTKVIDNTVTGNKIGQNTSSNQATLQDQEVKNSLQKSQGGFMVPIAPSKDVNMNVNQQQIQFNINY